MVFAVPIWSSINVGGMKLRDINPRIGEQDDPEKWVDIAEDVKKMSVTVARKIVRRERDRLSLFWAYMFQWQGIGGEERFMLLGRRRNYCRDS